MSHDVNKKIAQGCQRGTRRILAKKLQIDSPDMLLLDYIVSTALRKVAVNPHQPHLFTFSHDVGVFESTIKHHLCSGIPFCQHRRLLFVLNCVVTTASLSLTTSYSPKKKSIHCLRLRHVICSPVEVTVKWFWT